MVFIHCSRIAAGDIRCQQSSELLAVIRRSDIPREEGVVLSDGFEKAFVGELRVSKFGNDKADDNGGDGKELLFAAGLSAPPAGDGLGKVFF